MSAKFSHISILEKRKTFISDVLWLLYDFLSLKNDVLQKVIRKKTRKNFFFVIFLKVPDEKNRIRNRIWKSEVRIWIRTKLSRVRNTVPTIFFYSSWLNIQYCVCGGESECSRDKIIDTALAEESRMAARLLNDAEIEKYKRDFQVTQGGTICTNRIQW